MHANSTHLNSLSLQWGFSWFVLNEDSLRPLRCNKVTLSVVYYWAGFLQIKKKSLFLIQSICRIKNSLVKIKLHRYIQEVSLSLNCYVFSLQLQIYNAADLSNKLYLIICVTV